MTDLVDIRPEHLRIVQDVLRNHLPAGVEVRVFGSRAQGSARDASDLDLALEGETEIDRKVIEALADAFENSELPYTVDAVDINRVNERFRKIIKDQWVHLIPGGQWMDCTLADACDAIDYGLTASASDKPDGPRFLRITDIVSGPINWDSVPFVAAGEATTAKYRLNDGDIVIARTGASTGSSAYIKNPPTAVFASYLVRLVAKPEFDSRFLAYYLQSPNFKAYINGVLGDKSAQPNASASTMTKAPLYAPRSKREQRAISNVLGALDDKIELNRRMNETLEQMARALYKSWFVDFDPVRAKMDGRWRRGEPLPGLPAELYDLFPDRLVRSEVGEIPDGWEVRELSDCMEVARGLSYKGSGLTSEGIPMHNLNSVYEGGGYKDDGIKYYSGDFKERHITLPNDVLVANTEQGHDRLLIGFAAIVPKRFGERGLFSHHLYRVRPKEASELSPDFICHILNTHSIHHGISGYANGTTVNMLPVDALKLPSITIPPARLVAMFSGMAQTARLRQEQIILESRTLVSQRDALLPKLISGALRL